MITGPFAKILAANRSRFNTKFAEAHRHKPNLDADGFAEHLRSTVTPIVDAIDHECPEKTSSVADVLYDLSLDLLGQELLGPNSRYPLINEGWTTLLPHLARHIAESPQRVIGALTNALYNLSIVPGARPREWIESMLKLAEVCPDVNPLLLTGQAAAWRAGLAHYRQDALDICKRLGPALAATALGLTMPKDGPPIGIILDRLSTDPWLHPAVAQSASNAKPELKIVARVGAFRGFGGYFLTPPTVGDSGENFTVSDDTGTWLLCVDIFGATLQRSEAAASAANTNSLAPFRIERGLTVIKDRYSQTFPELETTSSAAANETTLAVTTPFSHSVYLIAVAA